MKRQTNVNHLSPAEDKIALFRSLFRGRDDVCPRRFESRKTGKAGYSPVCANEWVRGTCEKPRIKCADCTHQRFLPVTDDVIRWLYIAGRRRSRPTRTLESTVVTVPRGSTDSWAIARELGTGSWE